MPFISAIPGIDDDPAAEAAVQALVAPFKHLWGGDLSPEAAMAEVRQAEQRLLMARRAAKKVYKKAGLETRGMFDGPFVLREEARAEVPKKTQSAWEQEKAERAERGPAPKTPAQREMVGMRSRGPSEPVPVEPQDRAARERAVIEKFKASTPEQQAAMITAAAERHRPLKGK